MEVKKIVGQVAGKLASAVEAKGGHLLDVLDAYSSAFQDLLDEQKRTNDLLEQILQTNIDVLDIIDECAERKCKTLSDCLKVWSEVSNDQQDEDDDDGEVIQVDAERIE